MNTYETWMPEKFHLIEVPKRLMLVALILLFVPWVESTEQVLNAHSRLNLDAGPEVSAVTTDSPALTLLKNRFNSNVLFRAELSHQFTDSYTGETTSTYGTIWFSKDMYKIDTPDQLILVRDLISTVYNKRQKRVIYSNYDPEEDEFAPSRYFTGSNGAYISSDVANADGSVTIKITTEDPFEMFSEVNIRVSRDGSPVQIDAIDQMENTVRTTFRFGRFESFQNAVFTIQYPDDAEVVDMRQ